MKRWVWIATLLLAATGCRNDLQTSLWEQIKSLSEETTELSLEIEQLRAKNAALTEQVNTLAAIDRDVLASAMVVPHAVRIGRHSGLYDKSKMNQTPDSLVVYLEPIDAAQDTIKAAGSVRVELWNLADANDEPKLKTWQVSAEELKHVWGRGLLGAYYRLRFPLEGVLSGDERELTIRVQFTDYLAGRVLTDQKVITP